MHTESSQPKADHSDKIPEDAEIHYPESILNDKSNDKSKFVNTVKTERSQRGSVVFARRKSSKIAPPDAQKKNIVPASSVRSSSMWIVNHNDEIHMSRWPCNFLQSFICIILAIPCSAFYICSLLMLVPLNVFFSLLDLAYMGRTQLRCDIKPDESTYAIITGASSGLGTDFCHLLAKKGFNVIMVARREDRLKKLKEEIAQKYKVRAEYLVVDLGQEGAPKELYSMCSQLLNGIQSQNKTDPSVVILVNNAGVGCVEPFVCTELSSMSNRE